MLHPSLFVLLVITGFKVLTWNRKPYDIEDCIACLFIWYNIFIFIYIFHTTFYDVSPPSSFPRSSLAPHKSYSTPSFTFFKKYIEKKRRKNKQAEKVSTTWEAHAHTMTRVQARKPTKHKFVKKLLWRWLINTLI